MAGERGVEDEHRSHAVSEAEAVERLVHGLERFDAGDHARQVELARERELRELREIARGVSGAVVRAADRLVGEELDRGKRDVDVLRGEADDDRGSAGPQAVPGESHRLGVADHLERVVGAAARDP